MFEQRIKKKTKIEYGIFTVVAVSLSLSIQYSAKLGSNHRWILIISWGFYFIAFVISGLRIISDYEFFTLLEDNINSNSELTELKKKIETAKETIKKMDEDRLDPIVESIVTDTIKSQMSKLLLPFISARVRIITICFYMAGVLANIIFVSINLYS